jgi:outer membrane cobalamin receptor
MDVPYSPPLYCSNPERIVGRNALLLAILLAGRAAEQADTTRPKALDPVVVTADRAPGALRSSVSAVTRLSAATLARMPRATLADVLRMVPGFTVVDFDGLGFDPQLMARGFYGEVEVEQAMFNAIERTREYFILK